MKLTTQKQQLLLEISRKALEHIFKTGKEITIDESKISEELQEKGATFVTLTKKGNLRGCIGKLIPQKELYRDVIENTYAAAFRDYRFPQLKETELNEIKIEISVLGKPKKLEYKDFKELIKKLEKKRPGVIIEKGLHSATFLPQVWDEAKSPENFMSLLCQKAALEKNYWKNNSLEVYTYKVIKFSEK